MEIGYIWTEEQFTEDNHIVYRVRSQTGHSDYKSLKHYIAKLESSETKGISKNLKPFLKNKKTG